MSIGFTFLRRSDNQVTLLGGPTANGPAQLRRRVTGSVHRHVRAPCPRAPGAERTAPISSSSSGRSTDARHASIAGSSKATGARRSCSSSLRRRSMCTASICRRVQSRSGTSGPIARTTSTTGSTCAARPSGSTSTSPDQTGIEDARIEWRDPTLDVLATPAGRLDVLDEDELPARSRRGRRARTSTRAKQSILADPRRLTAEIERRSRELYPRVFPRGARGGGR